MREVINVSELAELLGSTPQSIRNQLSRGQEGITIPPSFKLGRRRVWLRKKVHMWLEQQAEGIKSFPRRGRPRSGTSTPYRASSPNKNK